MSSGDSTGILKKRSLFSVACLALMQENYSEAILNSLKKMKLNNCVNAQDGGLITVDGKKKPEYFVLKKLLKETWSTEWNGKLEEGKASFRGFYGKYRIRIPGYKPATFDLYSEGRHEVTIHLTKQ